MSSLVVVLGGAQHDAHERVRAAFAAAPHRGSPVDPFLRHGAALLAVSADTVVTDSDTDTAAGLAVAIVGTLDTLTELRRRVLAAPGGDVELRGRVNPAAVLACAVSLFGPSIAESLRGYYAAVVTDGDQLWAWRDHVGFRTLFYRHAAGMTVVASEAKQVQIAAGIERVVDLDVVQSIFYSAYGDETPAAITGVQRLPKASVLSADARRARSEHYWHPHRLLETSRLSGAALKEAFDQVMATAVDRSMEGRDLVSLSGGVDAPAVAGFAAPRHLERFGTPLKALSTVYPGFPRVDESEWISLIAQRKGLELQTFVPDHPQLGGIDVWMQRFDGPVPTIWVGEVEDFYTRARAFGAVNILTGSFAEYVIEMRDGLLPYLVKSGRPLAAWRFLAAKRRGGAHLPGLIRQAAMAVAPDPVTRAYRRFRSDFGGLPVPDFVDAGRVDQSSRMLKSTSRELWRNEQLTAFEGPGISLEADEVIQAVCGVRVRNPWLDIDVWELFLSLRAEVKFPESRYKGLAKTLLRGTVPDEVLDRRTFTAFDDSLVARMDYDGLRRWCIDPGWTMPGVDYAALRRRLDARDLTLGDYIWARDLATSHAFVEGASTS
ncbi:MAG: asparagine synthase-related protein [Mycobacteriales bacterium]